MLKLFIFVSSTTPNKSSIKPFSVILRLIENTKAEHVVGHTSRLF